MITPDAQVQIPSYQSAEGVIYSRRVAERSAHMPKWAGDLMQTFTPELAWKEQHSRVVGSIVGKLVERGGKFSPQQVIDMRLAGELHDVGDMAPALAALVNKSEKLTPDEYQLMKTHVTEGERLIKGDGHDPQRVRIAALVFGHHVYQRDSYPDGNDFIYQIKFPNKDNEDMVWLKEGWRLLGLADMVHAQMGSRPYAKTGKSAEETRDDLQTFLTSAGKRVFSDEEISTAISACQQAMLTY